MSQINVSAVYDAYGSNNAILYGVASPPSSMGFRNRIINGDMRIDQRNSGAAVTISGTTTYTLDRWLPQKSGTMNNYTAQRVAVAPPGHSYSQQFTAGTGVTPTGSDYAYLVQAIEGFHVSDLAWGTPSALAVTVSFWVRSSLTGTFGGSLRNANGTQSYVFSFPINTANTFEYKTVTIPGCTTGVWNTDNTTGITLSFDLGVGTTYSSVVTTGWQTSNFFGLTGGVKLVATTGATFNITGVQFEQGVVATAFERRDYGRELMMCQRYFELIGGTSISTRPAYTHYHYKVSKRGSSPTLTLVSGSTSGATFDVGSLDTASFRCPAGTVATATTDWIISSASEIS